MHHPGPPRFVGVGESVELAPRDPDPAVTYTWELVVSPAESTVALGGDPVEQFVPDAPGIYVTRLLAPDREHDLTVRAVPGEQSPADQAGAGRSKESRSSGPGRRGGRTGDGDGESHRAAATGEGGAGGRPRLALEPAVEGDDAVVRADPQPHPESSETPADLDIEFLVDDRDNVDRSAATIADGEFRLPVDELPERARVHAVAVGTDSYSVPDAVAFARQHSDDAPEGTPADDAPKGTPTDDASDATSIDATRPYDPPEWARDVFIYEIYVRSFGDEDTPPFDAVVDRLDYIESLGVDALWLTPVLQNDHAPHGYNITDFFSVAADLGSREDYEQLVEAAHDRDIAVLFDVVCNHSARTHPYFQNAVGDRDSEYRDWYEWRSETEPETYFEWEHIANFNFANLHVRRHLLDAFDEWLGLVDGFRCDMAWAVPDSFWRELHDRCKERDTEFLLLDETIPYIPDFQAGLFDVHFDSTTYFTLRQIGHGQDADTVLDAIDSRRDAGFPDHAGFMLYAENHDETRYITDCGRSAARATMGAVFTLPGAPMIYAGQEFGHRGRRDTLAWEEADSSLQEHVRRLARVRREHPALSGEATASRTRYEVRSGAPDRVTAYEMTAKGESTVVVLNFGSGPATVSVPEAGNVDALSGESVAVDDGSSSAVAVQSVVVLPRIHDPVSGT